MTLESLFFLHIPAVSPPPAFPLVWTHYPCITTCNQWTHSLSLSLSVCVCVFLYYWLSSLPPITSERLAPKWVFRNSSQLWAWRSVVTWITSLFIILRPECDDRGAHGSLLSFPPLTRTLKKCWVGLRQRRNRELFVPCCGENSLAKMATKKEKEIFCHYEEKCTKNKSAFNSESIVLRTSHSWMWSTKKRGIAVHLIMILYIDQGQFW